MKTLWEHKWLVIVGAVVILLSLGAIAWAGVAWSEASKNDAGKDQSRTVGVRPLGPAGGERPGNKAPAGPQGPTGRPQAMQKLNAQGVERLMVLLSHVRDEMSAEDQAKYDGLVQDIKDQREDLQKAREERADTLKELRALVAEYLGPPSDASDE